MPRPTQVTTEAVLDLPWAMLPSALTAMANWTRSSGTSVTLEALTGPHTSPERPAGVVAVIPVYGVIEHRSDWMTELMGGTSIDSIRDQMSAALKDPSVKAVILDIDSPGGTVAGMTEFAAEMRAARGGEKPIVAVANTLAASAAYWIASQADEVIVTPSGNVGSVGVYAVHQEASRMLDAAGITTTIVSAGEHKTEGNEFEPLTDEARADIQERVDSYYQQFLADVKAGRRATGDDDFGGGRVFSAKIALAQGMVDRIETLQQTIVRLSSTGGRRRALSAEGPEEEILAEDVDTTPPATTPFSERIAALAIEADEVLHRAEERARLRAKEGRPSFSEASEASLRSIRDALNTLLALDEPAQPEDPVEPVPTVAPSTPPTAATILRRLSDEEWMRHLEAMRG